MHKIKPAAENPKVEAALEGSGGSRLQLEMVGYPNPYETRAASLALSIGQLQNRALAIGSTFRSAGGPQTKAEAAMAAVYNASLPAVIDFDEPSIRVAAGHAGRDASEKGGLSFWVGMAVASFMAQNRLRCIQTCHVSLLLQPGELPVGTDGRRRPDLIGRELLKESDEVRHHVIEAKGKQRFGDKAEARWLQQAGCIVKINGCKPATSGFCATRIPQKDGGTLTCKMRDPEPQGPDRSEITYDEKAFLLSYYQPHLKRLKQLGGSQGQRVRTFMSGNRTIQAALYTVNADGTYLFAGLDTAIADAFASSPKRGVVSAGRGVDPFDAEGLTIGRDGIATVRHDDPCPPAGDVILGDPVDSPGRPILGSHPSRPSLSPAATLRRGADRTYSDKSDFIY